jgi:hypothetical protein
VRGPGPRSPSGGPLTITPAFNPPPTPPSQLEACLRLGLDVEDLYPQPESYFVERAAGHKPHLARVLAEHYETTRAAHIAEVKVERKKIAAELAATAAAHGVEGSSLAEIERARIAAAAKAAVEKERKRMEFIKAKQDREMQQNLEFELKLAQEAQKNMETMKAAAEEEERKKKEREAERKKMIEARRREELAKKEEEDQRAAEQRRLAQKEYEEEAKKEAAAAKEYKRLMAKRKAEEDERRAAALAEEQARLAEAVAKQKALEDRLKDLQEREAERAAKMAEFQARQRAEAAARAAAQAARMEAARQKDAEVLAKKRTDYELRLEEAARRNAEKAEKEAAEAAKAAAATAAKEARRLAGLARTREGEAEHIAKLLDDIKKREEHVAALRRETAQANEERALRELLHMAEKQDTIRRQRRRDEYARLMQLMKALADEEKLETQRQQKATMAAERQTNQKRLLLVRHRMEEELERMRVFSDFKGLQKMAGGTQAGDARPPTTD